MNRQIDFGLYIRMRDDYPSILKLAHDAEQHGFSIVYVNDHFLNLRDETMETLEAWTLMTAIGVQTDLRISHTVICNSFRNPALLAKMASTMDVITNGRFELGIGAGWHEREYHAYGFTFYKALIRINQLKEALQIIKQLWTEPETTFKGQYYTLEKCINMPKPVQKPHPPIMVGGEGDKILGVAAELADEANIPISLEKVEERVQFIRNYCETIGRDPKELRLSLFPRLVLAKDETELEPLIERYRPKDQSREEFLAAALVGTPEMVLARVQAYVELGISRFILIMYDPVPERLELFSSRVMSQFS
ncbi:MAG: LLM class flavin-dependent oxidoreductase [Candidatus Hodarchaeota archaeon]